MFREFILDFVEYDISVKKYFFPILADKNVTMNNFKEL